MRLLKLRLIAYGPFTDAEIDLAANGVHIVYGKNEAGKSTALRAITGLLYGIAKNTPDAHLHKMPDLRVGGTFLTEGGKGSISLTRRKGREHTLLDQGGRPVDEVVLSRLLGGVSQEQFLTSFGLDHESLRKGGNALLLGEGAGENLFSAALSGGEVHQILRGLRAEADALFTAKAHTKPLNEALRAFADATKAVREAAMSPDALLQQRELLDDLGRERAACEADRQRLMVERAKLVRAEQALPVLAKHQLLGERRRAMGDVVLLPPSARSNRALHLRTVSETTQETARLNARLADLATRRDRLVVPEGLVRYKEVPLDLANRLGSHRKAARDLPRLHGEIEELEAEALTVLRKLGREVTLEKAEAWRVDAAALGSIRRVAKEKAKLAEEHRQNQRALAEKRSRMALLVAKRDQVGSLPDAGALRKAVTRAEREGPLDDRLAKLEAHVNLLQQDAESELGSLGQRHSSPEAAAALPVPLPETIERFARQWATREADALRVIGESTEQEALLARLAREIKALELAGRVPTEPALIAAREQRDRTWKVLRGSEGLPSAETFDQFERQLREADELSDRLRREAERVSRLAVLLAERDSAALRKAALTREQERLERERLDEQAAWRAAWSGTGVDPRPPAEMKPWVQRHAKLVRTADELRRARSEAASLRAVIAMHALPIRDMLEAAGGALPPSPGLGALLDHAGEVLEKMARAVQEKRETERLLEELTLETAELAAGEKRRAEEAERLAPTWDAAARSLGLSGSASPDEATDAIDWLSEAFRKIDQIAAAGRRAAGIERDGKAFAEDVARLVAEHAPELAASSAESAAAELIERHRQGIARAAERREIERQLADAEQLCAEQIERQSAAERELDDLVRAAGVGGVADLEVAEARSEEARKLDEELAALDARLFELGGNADTLRAELGGEDLDAVTARLEGADEELDQLRRHGSELDVRIGGAQSGLLDLEHPRAKAAEAAAEAESCLARVRNLAESYIKVKVAGALLSREIERYRKENQGPIVSRASELFHRLTLGSFAALTTTFDEKDQPVLRGVRTDGSEIAIDGMSDGTRDQLFLALRLSTLERYVAAHEPMPLVLDDILVHFDDDRARAALEVLGDLATHTQVLFFTHHTRLVDLATQTLPKGKVFVREIDRPLPSPSASVAANGAQK